MHTRANRWIGLETLVIPLSLPSSPWRKFESRVRNSSSFASSSLSLHTMARRARRAENNQANLGTEQGLCCIMIDQRHVLCTFEIFSRNHHSICEMIAAAPRCAPASHISTSAFASAPPPEPASPRPAVPLPLQAFRTFRDFLPANIRCLRLQAPCKELRSTPRSPFEVYQLSQGAPQVDADQ